MRCWTRCALCDDYVLQAKQFSTKYHPVVVDSTLFETDLWRKKLLTRPGPQGELVTVSMVQLKRLTSSKVYARSVLQELEFPPFEVLYLISTTNKQTIAVSLTLTIQPLPS